jgi:hypothetical protein
MYRPVGYIDEHAVRYALGGARAVQAALGALEREHLVELRAAWIERIRDVESIRIALDACVLDAVDARAPCEGHARDQDRAASHGPSLPPSGGYPEVSEIGERAGRGKRPTRRIAAVSDTRRVASRPASATRGVSF